MLPWRLIEWSLWSAAGACGRGCILTASHTFGRLNHADLPLCFATIRVGMTIKEQYSIASSADGVLGEVALTESMVSGIHKGNCITFPGARVVVKI